jgi:beta-lactamase class A
LPLVNWCLPFATTLLLLLAALPGGHTGSIAAILDNPQTPPLLTLNPAHRFPMQSVYKFPIAMAILHQVDEGRLQLDQPVRVAKAELVPPGLRSPLRDGHPAGDFDAPLRDIIRYAVSESDGTASDVLLRLAGGPAQIQLYLRSLGVTEIAIANTEMQMSRDDTLQYRNWATPRGMLTLLRAFHQGKGLTPASRDYLMQLMIHTPTGPNRLKGILPAGAIVAHKTGTSGTRHGLTAATNDVGLITLPNGKTLAIAVFVSDAPGDDAARESIIAKTARAAWDMAVHP